MSLLSGILSYFQSGSGNPLEGATLIPSKEGGPFLDVWSDLTEQKYLYSAVGVAENGNGKAVAGEVMMSLDYMYRSYSNGHVKASSVYTDKKVFKPATLYAEIPV